MNDNDVPDMPDRLEIEITADDYAKLRELSKTSDITHCIRCLATSPGGGDPGWGAGGFRNRLAGDEMLYVHRLVLSAFVRSCPPGMECCHWDDDKANNNVWNLRWASRSANIKDWPCPGTGTRRNVGARQTDRPTRQPSSSSTHPVFRTGLASRQNRLFSRHGEGFWDALCGRVFGSRKARSISTAAAA